MAHWRIGASAHRMAHLAPSTPILEKSSIQSIRSLSILLPAALRYFLGCLLVICSLAHRVRIRASAHRIGASTHPTILWRIRASGASRTLDLNV